MTNTKTERQLVGAYLDVQNIYYTVKQQYNAHFNYQSFMKEYLKGKDFGFAIAFATNKNDKNQKCFQGLLRSYGYQVKLIDYILRQDQSAKADWDVGITLEIMNDLPRLKKLILVSGDGDFAFVVESLKKRKNVEVVVVGVAELTAAKLIQHADEFIPIKDDLLLPIPNKW